MASKTEVANRALVKLGEKRITSIDDDNKPARTLSSMFDRVRDAELRKRRWSFAIKRAQLAADSDAPAFGYSAQFTLPVDCLRVLQVSENGFGPDLSDLRSDIAPYAIEGRKLLIDASAGSALPLRYIAAIADTTQWDALFIEVIACKLAIEACETLTGSTDKRRQAWEEYRHAIAEAVRANAIEMPSRAVHDDTWVTARSIG